ncbi:MAG: Unknown protein [uncultured Aureispira sp.]|uniref:Uncharacterized protein n=1 Tax=uncultured Aureispira sp. TaxID=1331704 RepID=A0A6S6TA13_9BACT|nr:MAG: Unknown protein [uncultured Aureispira sp.]
MKKISTNINRLLASTVAENNQLAFQILKGDPTLLTEAIFPLLAWRLFALDFDKKNNENNYPLSNTDIANDILSITTLLEEESISKPFYNCDNSLDIFIERLDLYSTEKVKKMLENIYPCLVVYNRYLQKDKYYVEQVLFISREIYHTYNLHALVYPFYHFLTKTDALEIIDKVDFINLVNNLSYIDKEKYEHTLDTALEYANDIITTQPIYAAEYHDVKGLLYRRYGKYQEAIISYEKSHQLTPKKETVLNSLAWLLYQHTDRQTEAYAHATKAVKTNPLPDHINTLAHLELIYKGNIIKAKELFEQVLDIDPDHLDSIQMLEKIIKKWQ